MQTSIDLLPPVLGDAEGAVRRQRAPSGCGDVTGARVSSPFPYPLVLLGIVEGARGEAGGKRLESGRPPAALVERGAICPAAGCVAFIWEEGWGEKHPFGIGNSVSRPLLQI